jgi:hypothetical protein
VPHYAPLPSLLSLTCSYYVQARTEHKKGDHYYQRQQFPVVPTPASSVLFNGPRALSDDTVYITRFAVALLVGYSGWPSTAAPRLFAAAMQLGAYSFLLVYFACVCLQLAFVPPLDRLPDRSEYTTNPRNVTSLARIACNIPRLTYVSCADCV